VIYVWVWIQMQKQAYGITLFNVKVKFQRISKWTKYSTIFPYKFNTRHIGHWRCRQMPVGSTLLWVQAMFLEILVTKTCQCLNKTRLISVLSSRDCLYTFTHDVHCQFIHICHTRYIWRTKTIYKLRVGKIFFSCASLYAVTSKQH